MLAFRLLLRLADLSIEENRIGIAENYLSRIPAQPYTVFKSCALRRTAKIQVRFYLCLCL